MTREQETAGVVVLIAAALWWLTRTSAAALTPSVTTSETYNLGLTQKIRNVANAIARAEGYFVSGSVPNRANNPGDLALGGQTIGEGITVFPTSADGWNALYGQLARILNGTSSYYSLDMSIADMGAIWSGGNATWATNVASILGVPTSTPLVEVLV